MISAAAFADRVLAAWGAGRGSLESLRQIIAEAAAKLLQDVPTPPGPCQHTPHCLACPTCRAAVQTQLAAAAGKAGGQATAKASDPKVRAYRARQAAKARWAKRGSRK